MFCSIFGVTKRKTIKSLLREFGWEMHDSAWEIMPASCGRTFVIGTDTYEGVSSEGLGDGSGMVSPETWRRFLMSSRLLGTPVILVRTRIPVSTIAMPNGTESLSMPEICALESVESTLDDLDINVPLPFGKPMLFR